jgi:4-amino-4-deoxy-L-arabinose transferase
MPLAHFLDGRKGLAAAGMFVCVMAFCFQGSRGLWAPDEGRYAAGAASMLDNGDYSVSRLNHTIYLNKPPLTFWGIAAGLKVLGWNAWGARAFHALCLIATAAVVGALGTCLWSRAEGFLAAVIYVTMPTVIGGANALTPDTPLTLWCALSFLCFWKAVAPAGNGVRWKALLGLALGLGALTKGPAALIPTGPMFLYLLLTRQTLRFFVSPWLLLGAVFLLALPAWWYIPVIRSIPGAGEYLWTSQLWGRLVSDTYKRHAGFEGALVIYGPALTLGTLPWSLLGIVAAIRLKVPVFTRRWWLGLRDRPALLLVLLWVVIPTIVLSAATSKLPLYILPIFPGLALLAARGCLQWWSMRTPEKAFPSARFVILTGVWALVLLGAKIGICSKPTDRDMRALWEAMLPQLPDEPRCLVAVDQDLTGVAFYSRETVTQATTLPDPYPDFVRERPLADEIAAARDCKLRRVFIVKSKPKREAAFLEGRRQTVPVHEQLSEAGVPFDEVPITQECSLLICRPGRDSAPVTRLAFVYDDGRNTMDTLNIADGLYRLSRETNLQGVVFLNQATPATREGRQPYERLVQIGIPLFGAAGTPENLPATAMLRLACADVLDTDAAREAAGRSLAGNDVAWKALALRRFDEQPATKSWLAQQNVQVVVTSDLHVYTRAAIGKGYDDHGLPALPGTVGGLTTSFNKQLILIVEASADSITFRVCDSLLNPLDQWSLKKNGATPAK